MSLCVCVCLCGGGGGWGKKHKKGDSGEVGRVVTCYVFLFNSFCKVSCVLWASELIHPFDKNMLTKTSPSIQHLPNSISNGANQEKLHL